MKSIDWHKKRTDARAEQRKQNKSIHMRMLGKKFEVNIKEIPINIRPLKEEK